MSGDIVLSSAIRSNLLALQSTADLQASVQNHLATGLKVSSALDNASSYFTASGFSTRAGQLSNLLDSVGNSIQTLKAASNGIDSITKLVDNLRATARQALQSPSAYSTRATVTSSAGITGATTSDLRGSNSAATAIGTKNLSGANTIGTASTLTINGTNVNLLATDTGTTAVASINAVTATTGVTASLNGSGFLVLTQGDNTTNLVVSGTGATATTSGIVANTFSPSNALDTKTLTFTVGSGANQKVASFTFSSTNKSIDDLNNALSAAGLTASLDSTGKISVSTTSQSESQTFTVTGTGALPAFGSATPTVSAPVRAGAGASTRDGLVSQYNGLLSQIDSLARDSSFNGVNLLKGDTLSVVFNETSTAKLDIRGGTFDSGGLGVNSVASSDFNDGNSINAVIAKLDAATTNLQVQASKFGSNLAVVQTRQDFSKTLINTLQAGADNLTLADTNEEAANLLSLQTRQQLSQTSLSLANQAAQGVLRLF